MSSPVTPGSLRRHRARLAAVGLTAALALGAAACGSDSGSSAKGSTSSAASGGTPMGGKDHSSGAPAASFTKASDLRVALTSLLQEHVILAADATNAALGGRQSEFDGAAAELDDNSNRLSAAIGSVYGDSAGQAFSPLWKKHIGFFVDYTKATAAKDAAGRKKAVDDLTSYSQELAAFLSSANPNLPKDTVAGLVGEHVMTLKVVVDAQASGDQAAAYTALGMAVQHMTMLADPLSSAIATQMPDEVGGDPMSASSTLRTGLTSLFQQHVAYASAATNAALGGRQGEFDAAVALLDTNSDQISAAVESVLGDSAGQVFSALWKKQIGMFVDYTKATGAKDKAGQDRAVVDLTAYTQEFAAFLSSASPSLTKDAVAGLVKEHVLTLKAVVDAQAAGDPTKAFAAQGDAWAHMTMLADPLTQAIAAQVPQRFPA